MKRITTILIALLIFSVSCTKNESSTLSNEEALCMEGRIRWHGDPAIDGLGWVFMQNEQSKKYVLKYLKESFRTNNLSVSICLQSTNEIFPCLCSTPVTVYQITSIRKQ